MEKVLLFPATSQLLQFSSATSSSSSSSRLFCVVDRSGPGGFRSVLLRRDNPPFSGRLRGGGRGGRSLLLPEVGIGVVVAMATTTTSSSSSASCAPVPVDSLETLEEEEEEETKLAAAALETASLRRSGTSVEAVFFDLDDTLVLTHAADTVAHKAVQALVQRRIPHMNGDEMLKVFIVKFDVQPWDLTHQVEVTEWRARIWGEALKSQGVEDMDLARDMQRCFDEERMLSFQWAPGVEAMVRRLHAQGIKVGIITNGHFSVQRTKLKACKADQLFDTILVGGEEPNQKPHKDIFLKACRLAGSKPEKSIMVGDNLKTDIQGARNVGFLATVWVNVHNLERPPAGGPAPHHIISNIGELPGLLKELGALSKDPPKTSAM